MAGHPKWAGRAPNETDHQNGFYGVIFFNEGSNIYQLLFTSSKNFHPSRSCLCSKVSCVYLKTYLQIVIFVTCESAFGHHGLMKFYVYIALLPSFQKRHKIHFWHDRSLRESPYNLRGSYFMNWNYVLSVSLVKYSNVPPRETKCNPEIRSFASRENQSRSRRSWIDEVASRGKGSRHRENSNSYQQ